MTFWMFIPLKLCTAKKVVLVRTDVGVISRARRATFKWSLTPKPMGKFARGYSQQSLTTPLPEDIRIYSSILKKPFLLLNAEPNSFGGFFVFIVSKDYPNVLRV